MKAVLEAVFEAVVEAMFEAAWRAPLGGLSVVKLGGRGAPTGALMAKMPLIGGNGRNKVLSEGKAPDSD